MTDNVFDLTGKVAIITGASGGIGFAIAETFAQAGAKVVLSSRKQEALDQAAERLKPTVARYFLLPHILATLTMSGVWWLPAPNILVAWIFWSIMQLPIHILGHF